MTESIVQIGVGNATNVFLIRGHEGCILVDTGLPGQADLILERLAAHGVAPADVRLILITHGHADHFGSAAALRERTAAPVAVHARDAEAVRRGTNPPETLRPTSWLVRFLMRVPAFRFPAHAPACEPDVLFEDEWRLDEAGLRHYRFAGRVLPTPGHTPGSASLLLDSGEAIAGDMVMGFMGRPRPPFVAWDLKQNWESLGRLLALSPRLTYLGHGGPFRPEALAALARVRR